MRAFQPQNPRPIDANTTLNKDAKCPPPALVDKEGLLRLDGTMGTGPAVARLFSGLEFSRVVLDFLFCCHNLEIDFLLGDAPRSFTIWCGPFFYFSEATKHSDRRRAKKQGRGPILRKTGRGPKRAAGYRLREKRD